MRSKSAPGYYPNIKSDLLIWYNHSNVATLMSSHLWPNLGELLAVIALLTLWPTASEPQGSTSSKQYHSCGTCSRAFLWYWLSLWNLQGLDCSKACFQQAATTPTSLGTDSLCLQASGNLSNLRQLHSTTFGSNGSFWHLWGGRHQPGHCSRAHITNGNVEGIEKAKSPHIWYMCFVLPSHRVQSHFPSHFRGLGPARMAAENGYMTHNPSWCVVLRITCKGYLTPALLIPWQCQFLQTNSIKKCSNAALRRYLYHSENPIIQFYLSSPISFSRLIGCWLRQSAMRSQSAIAETETTRTYKNN